MRSKSNHDLKRKKESNLKLGLEISLSLFMPSILFLSLLSACATPSKMELKSKADQAVAIYKEWAAEGLDLSSVTPRMKKVKQLSDAGKIREAIHLLDDILAYFDNHRNVPMQKVASTDEFTNNAEVTIVGYDGDVMEAFISRDNRYLFFNNDKHGPQNKDIFYAERIDDYHFRFKGEVKNINTKTVDGVPSMDVNGNFYFVSLHNYKPPNFVTVYKGRFKDGAVKSIYPLDDLSLKKPGWVNMDIEISSDGQTLYSTHTYFGRKKIPSQSYFFYAKKQGSRFIPQSDSEKVFEKLNHDNIVYGATISTDEREILYTRLDLQSPHPVFETLRATRPDKHGPFGEPKIISAITGFAEAPALTGDGSLIYYHKKSIENGQFKLYVLHRMKQK